MRLLVLVMEGQVEDGRIVLLLLGGSFSLFFFKIFIVNGSLRYVFYVQI